MSEVEYVLVGEIVVGQRSRKDYGDLSDLMESIRTVGLLQPVGLAPDNHLLFGGRRLEAVRRLGWDKVPVTRPTTQTDAISLLIAERDENTCRKDMTVEELVDLGLRLEELAQPSAEERRREGGRKGGRAAAASFTSDEVKLPPRRGREGWVNEVVAEGLGVSPATYFRSKTVVKAARGEKGPELQPVAEKALAELNEGKIKVHGAYDRLRPSRRQEPPPPAPAPAPRPGGNRRKHLQMLQALTTGLAGYAYGAGEITELDGSVTSDEAARLLDDLTTSLHAINRIKRLLKERTQP